MYTYIQSGSIVILIHFVSTKLLNIGLNLNIQINSIYISHVMIKDEGVSLIKINCFSFDMGLNPRTGMVETDGVATGLEVDL